MLGEKSGERKWDSGGWWLYNYLDFGENENLETSLSLVRPIFTCKRNTDT